MGLFECFSESMYIFFFFWKMYILCVRVYVGRRDGRKEGDRFCFRDRRVSFCSRYGSLQAPWLIMIVPAGNGGDTRLSVPFPARAASPPCGSKRRTLPRNYCALQQRARRGIEEGPLPFIFPLHLPPNSRRFFIRPSSGLSFPVIAIFLFSPSPSLLSTRFSKFLFVSRISPTFAFFL